MALRRFRDEKLAKSKAGRLFIKAYYRLSPPLAKRLKNTKLINSAMRKLLDKFVNYLDYTK